MINILTAAKIPFETVDISVSEEQKQFMFEILKKVGKSQIAPKLFMGDQYLGVSFLYLFNLWLNVFQRN